MKPTVVKSVSIRDEALAAIEGLAELEEAVERTQTFVVPQPGPVPDTFQLLQDAIESVTETVLDGYPIPEDAARSMTEALVRSQEPEQFRIVVQGVHQRLEGERDQAFTYGLNAAYSVLRHHLERILDEVREGRDSDLQRLVDEYDQVRSAQFSLTTRLIRQQRMDTHRPPNLLSTAGLLRDFIDVFTYFQDRRHDNANRSVTSSTSASVYREWLHAVPVTSFDGTRATSPWWLTDDPAKHLRWLASDGQPWIPTFSEIESAYAAAVTATSLINGYIAPDQEQARDRYFRITGAKDPYAGMPREERSQATVWVAPTVTKAPPKPRTWLEQQAQR